MFEIYEAQNGTVNYKGEEIALMQEPYLWHLCNRGDHYKALGLKKDGSEVSIWWPIINHDCEDESNACDWEDFFIEEATI